MVGNQSLTSRRSLFENKARMASVKILSFLAATVMASTMAITVDDCVEVNIFCLRVSSLYFLLDFDGGPLPDLMLSLKRHQ